MLAGFVLLWLLVLLFFVALDIPIGSQLWLLVLLFYVAPGTPAGSQLWLLVSLFFVAPGIPAGSQLWLLVVLLDGKSLGLQFPSTVKQPLNDLHLNDGVIHK